MNCATPEVPLPDCGVELQVIVGAVGSFVFERMAIEEEQPGSGVIRGTVDTASMSCRRTLEVGPRNGETRAR